MKVEDEFMTLYAVSSIKKIDGNPNVSHVTNHAAITMKCDIWACKPGKMIERLNQK